MFRPLNGVILAGGEGTRLRPLTDSLPKPMLPILDVPCIKYVVSSLAQAGIQGVYLTCGYKSEDLIQNLRNVNFGVDVHFTVEEQPAGTAGAVKLLEDQLSDVFVVASGDVLADVDMNVLLNEHQQSGAVATMALTSVENPSEFGIVGLDETGAVTRFKEKPAAEEVFSNLINAGIYILNKEVLEYIPAGEKFDFSKQLFPALLEDGKKIQGSVLQGMWVDIGHPDDLLRANLQMAERRGTMGDRNNARCEGPIVSSNFATSGCTVVGPAYIGANVSIGDNAILNSAAVGHDSIIGADSELNGVFMRNNCTIGRDCRLQNVLLGEGCKITDGSILSDAIFGDYQKS
ncbi:sugar phosphate nucleotidyltransferase [Candidatus Methanomassiliicoccus intestinalis]|jgi:mannose-1-phosphate guanyltransferase related protein|uniref:sugar phosphate nucleotidyltransferase n=1 Tax=Candidatus Methanomassiliicoccus intestinalis TaxID=1406512 RepID=UPI0037DDBB7B